MIKRFIVTLLIALILPWQLVSAPIDVYAEDTSGDQNANLDDNTALEAPEEEDGVEEAIQPNELTQIANGLNSLQSRRGARGDITIEHTLPRLGLSQCDLNLVRTGQIDNRVLKALNYLVSPTGGDMTYLHVTFSKECEEEVPELIGDAYPVEFEDTAPKPPLINPALLVQEAPKENTDPLIDAVSSLDITPSAHAAATPATAVEPPDAQSVHDNGQAVDVVAAGLVMCTTKSGGIFGAGAKISRQAPRPIKVSWQTDAGVAGVSAPFGANFDQMAETAGLDEFLEGFTSQDGTFRARALDGAFTMMGFNLLAGQLGIKPGSFDAATDPLTYSTLGYAWLADQMKLPDSSVFNPFMDGIDKSPNPLVKDRNNFETLLNRSVLRTVEKDLKLNAGSLEGDSFEEVLQNAAKRRLEKDLGLRAGSFSADITKPDQIFLSLGQAKMDSYFRWPSGATKLDDNRDLITALSARISKLMNAGDNLQYGEKLVRGALRLPSSVTLTNLYWKDGNYWSTDEGRAVKETLRDIDRQLFPGANGGAKPKSLFDNGRVPIVDAVLTKSTDDLTFRLITGDLKLKDYQTILGVGSILSDYGAYGSAQRAFGLPDDISVGNVVGANGSIIKVDRVTNQFLVNLLGGNKNNWSALGTETIGKALGMHPDARFKKEVVTIIENERYNQAEKYSGIVDSALKGELDKIHFSGSKATLSINLNPRDLLIVLGAGLATDRSGANATKLAEARFNTLIGLGKERFGNMFDAVAKNAIGDQSALQALYSYDQSRPDKTPFVDNFSITGNGQAKFSLSYPAIDIQKTAIMNDESGTQDVNATLSSDHRTITLDSGDVSLAFPGDTIRVTYTVRAQRSGQNGFTPDTFASLINNSSAIQSLVIQIGAAKLSTALKLPPSALALASGLIDPKSHGIGSVGQSALESFGGLTSGGLTGKALSDLPLNTINRMFALESGWYDKIKSKDQDFLNANGTALYTTDERYRIELGSTEQLLTGAITLAQYQKRIGNAQLQYNAGSVLASTFGVHVLGYRLTAQDFTDMIEGSYYKPMLRFGARLQERNHGLPIGALATSIITGKNNVSLWSLGTNFLASSFHLNTLDLTKAANIGDVKNAIGKSSIEQALGFKENTFSGGSPLDVARSVGAENFANAFGIPIPDLYKAKLKNITYNYHPELAQQDRDEIIYKYLSALLQKPSGSVSEGEENLRPDERFNQSTLGRFEAVDRTLGIEVGSTLKFMQHKLSGDDLIHKTSVKAVDNRVTAGLAEILGVDPAYVTDTKELGKLFDGSKDNDPAAFGSLYNLVQKFGGLNLDAQLGWDKGAFQHLIANSNNALEFKKTLVSQGAKKLARYIGIDKDTLRDLELRLNDGSAKDLELALHDVGAAKMVSLVGVEGFTIGDADALMNGHFSDGALMVGTAFMSKSDDIKKAGITYEELKLSVFGDPVREENFMFDQIAKDYPGLADNARGHDQELLGLRANTAGQTYREISNRSFMTEARQSVSFKFMDYQVRQLLPDVIVPQGFARAMLGGKYSYSENGQTLTLTGDDARRRMGQLTVINYVQSNNKILEGIPDTYLLAVTDFLADQDADKLQAKLSLNGDAGFKAIGRQLDPVFSKVFGTTLASGTSSALLAYASNGNATAFQKNIWQSWQLSAFNFADKALGFQSGTAGVIYQGISGYQSALSAYQSVTGVALDAIAGAGTIEEFNQAITNANKSMNTASRQFKTQTAMLIASVANVVFQKQFSQVESALGIQPGTLIYLIQYLISPDPISLGLFIFFNFLWGKSSTSCGVDQYPRGGTSTSPAVLSLQSAILANQPDVATTLGVNANAASSATNPITKALTPPKPFNGQSNEAYRKGIKAGAQYEVRRLVGSLLLMPTRANDINLKPLQLAALNNDDLAIFEPLSVGLYGPLNGRQSKPLRGPGTFETLTDRVHLGY